MSKQHLGICQLGLHWEEEEALPQASASLGPCCLPTPGEGADWALARTQLGSAVLVLSPAGPSPWSHLLAGPQLGLGLERPRISGWGWEGGRRIRGEEWGAGGAPERGAAGGLGWGSSLLCGSARGTEAHTHPVTPRVLAANSGILFLLHTPACQNSI